MLRLMLVAFGVMQVSACFSVLTALLIEDLGTLPVSLSVLLFTGSFTAVIAAAIKQRLEVR